MSKRAKLARQREDNRAALVGMIDRKAAPDDSKAVKMTIANERVAARKARSAMANTWIKREQNPGKFHNPKAKSGPVTLVRS